MSKFQDLYKNQISPDLMKKFSYKSIMQTPRLEKAVLNIGMGEEASKNPKGLETAMEEIASITGQKPIKTIARKSIAAFKLREGMTIGCKVTLRGSKMYEFIERLVKVALPRVRDFKGVDPNGFDGRGNYNLSIKEQIIFPEINVDKVDTYHGMNITFVTTAKSDEEGRELLVGFGMPYKKKS